jgi:hypothetical protein
MRQPFKLYDLEFDNSDIITLFMYPEEGVDSSDNIYAQAPPGGLGSDGNPLFNEGNYTLANGYLYLAKFDSYSSISPSKTFSLYKLGLVSSIDDVETATVELLATATVERPDPSPGQSYRVMARAVVSAAGGVWMECGWLAIYSNVSRIVRASEAREFQREGTAPEPAPSIYFDSGAVINAAHKGYS